MSQIYHRWQNQIDYNFTCDHAHNTHDKEVEYGDQGHNHEDEEAYILEKPEHGHHHHDHDEYDDDHGLASYADITENYYNEKENNHLNFTSKPVINKVKEKDPNLIKIIIKNKRYTSKPWMPKQFRLNKLM